MATLCAALEIKMPYNAGPDSWNVLPAWLGQISNAPLREATVCVSQFVATISIRQGPWKLLVKGKQGSSSESKYGIDGPELYNLTDDPIEQTDLVERHPNKVDELTKLLERYRLQGHSRPGWRSAP